MNWKSTAPGMKLPEVPEEYQRPILDLLFPLLFHKAWRTDRDDAVARFVLDGQPFPGPEGARFQCGLLTPARPDEDGLAWFLDEAEYSGAFAWLPPPERAAWGALLDERRPRKLFYRLRTPDGGLEMRRNPDVPAEATSAAFLIAEAVRVRPYTIEQARAWGGE